MMGQMVHRPLLQFAKQLGPSIPQRHIALGIPPTSDRSVSKRGASIATIQGPGAAVPTLADNIPADCLKLLSREQVHWGLLRPVVVCPLRYLEGFQKAAWQQPQQALGRRMHASRAVVAHMKESGRGPVRCHLHQA